MRPDVLLNLVDAAVDARLARAEWIKFVERSRRFATVSLVVYVALILLNIAAGIANYSLGGTYWVANIAAVALLGLVAWSSWGTRREATETLAELEADR